VASLIAAEDQCALLRHLQALLRHLQALLQHLRVLLTPPRAGGVHTVPAD
jgi:hypothetical protein